MVVLIVILILIAGFLLWLLVAPFRLIIDTVNHDYRISIPGVFGLKIIPDEQQVLIARITILIIPIKLGLVKTVGWVMRRNRRKALKREKKLKVQSGKPELKRRKRKEKRKSKVTFRQILNVMKSFQIRRFNLNLDTGDGLWNGLLTPVFIYVSSENRQLTINYYEEFSLQLEVRNSMIRVLYALIRK